MIGEKYVDCREMFEHACSFCECADMAEYKFCHDTAAIGIYLVPAMVNSAFACEVFLKMLLNYYNIPHKNEHNLKVLYEMLPFDINMLIFSQMFNFYGPEWNDQCLEENSDAFIYWRYIYELDWRTQPVIDCDTRALKAFRNLLREACCGILFRTTWCLYEGGEYTPIDL